MPLCESLNGEIEEPVATLLKSLFSNPLAPSPLSSVLPPQAGLSAFSLLFFIQTETVPVFIIGPLPPSVTTALSSANFPPSQSISFLPVLLDLPPPPSPLSLSQALTPAHPSSWSAAGPGAPLPVHPGARCCRDAHMERMRCAPLPGYREDNDLSASLPGHDENQ